MASNEVRELQGRKARGCPFHTQLAASKVEAQWWPNKLNLKNLGRAVANPTDGEKPYGEEFKTLDVDALKADIMAMMTDSQSWWPADYGTYAPFFVRMAWHSAGTYRTTDGRGGGGTGNLRYS